MNRRIAPLLAVALAALAPSWGQAAQWSDHRFPFDFLFGNDFDTHQQTRQGADGSLSGFLYVSYTGTVTSDGYAVATHLDCATAACSPGWRLAGETGSGQLLYHIEPDHPVFLVNRADIPLPGAYSHFHWLGDHPAAGETREGYFLQLKAIKSFCFVHHDAASATADRSCRDNGGIAVQPGIDGASHLNIVTSAP